MAAVGDAFVASAFIAFTGVTFVRSASLVGLFLTGVAPVAVLDVLEAVVARFEVGVAAFLIFGALTDDLPAVGVAVLAVLAVCVAGFEAWLAVDLFAAMGVFFAEITPEGVEAAGVTLVVVAGRGFFVPIGVRVGVAFEGVDVAFDTGVLDGVEVLFSFAGAFLTGVAVLFAVVFPVEDWAAFFIGVFTGVFFGVVVVSVGVLVVGFFAVEVASATFAMLPTLV